MNHLTQRVAWHDNKWNGTICNKPSCNSFCIALDRIHEIKNDAKEDKLHSMPWSDLKPDKLPPCSQESGGFMNETEWTRLFVHPYRDSKSTQETHGHLLPTSIKVPAYSSFSVPFSWMLRENQKDIDESLPEPLITDRKPPFNTAWVFGQERQEALLDLVFNRLNPESSLVFYYCKNGHPMGESIPRLVVGVGRILSVAPISRYNSSKETTYPMWDRLIRHSIRPKGHDGFLLPYHEYLEPTGNSEEDGRRLGLLNEIIVVPGANHIRMFSYASELAGPDVALSTLIQILEAVRKIREHGIAKGPWDKREEWLNQQIAQAWKDRGAYPGLGVSIEALGLRMGTALHMELLSTGIISSEDNPWPEIDKIVKGERQAPQPAYDADLQAMRQTWIGLPEERRQLLMLLSRFDLTAKQANRWFNSENRDRISSMHISDADILTNPYIISELDLGEENDVPVTVSVIDRGLIPDDTIRIQHPVPEPSSVSSPNDFRRVRAAIVAVLKEAADNGDALLSIAEALESIKNLNFTTPCVVTLDWINANQEVLNEMVKYYELTSSKEENRTAVLQLLELYRREKQLSKILVKRAEKKNESLEADWDAHLKEAILASGGSYDPDNSRHVAAFDEQAKALENVTTRRLTALVGRAGSGKTSVLGALLQCESLAKQGVLLLAPTGKARVRLAKATNANAMTVAQFLNSLGRYDALRQRPLFIGGEKYRREKNVVIDECSMLTMDDLLAILQALDLAHVQRIILVGDPNQLPPIGVGRPFADFVGHLEKHSSGKKAGDIFEALARLTVEVRASVEQPSDTLRLASWFTRESQMVDADRVLSDLEMGKSFNDLEVAFWQSPAELQKLLLEQFEKHLGIQGPDDVAGFDRTFGFDERGWMSNEKPDGIENFQILSPVRMHPHGVYGLNRWVQHQFRAKQVSQGQQFWGVSLGDESIVKKDKVIQVRNQTRQSYNWGDGSKEKYYLANGEIGTAGNSKLKGSLNIVFAGRPNLSFSYSGRDFSGGSGPLELAYALTIHKSQGSEFEKVFVVLPKKCSIVSRELLYTALTRSKKQIVLLVEGDDISTLYDLTRPEKSETARRNTNLFEEEGAVRIQAEDIPYADHLIHRTLKGHMVRSKSELVIANELFNMGIEYEYERKLEGETAPGKLRPDFSFIDAAGDLIIWEHLGLMHREDYRTSWNWKREWYKQNGYEEGETLFTTEDDENGGLDSEPIKRNANKIKELL